MAERNILEIDGERVKGQPHGWIQWKGTDVCMDLHCACGAHLHADTDFLYSWICPHCKRHYVSGSHVPMYELTAEESAKWISEGGCLREVEPDGDLEEEARWRT